MNIPELLGKIREINKQLLRMERHIDNLGESALKATSVISAVRYGGTPDHCKHEYAVLEADAIESDQAELRIRLRVLRADVQPYIGLMPPGPERAAAHMRYIDGRSCTAIGRALHYNRTYVYELLDAAEQTLIQIEAAKRPDNIRHYQTP